METSPVIHLVTDAKGTVIHEVHVQMQELPLGMKALAPEVGAGWGNGLSAQCQALSWALAPVGTRLTWACLPAARLVAGQTGDQWLPGGREGCINRAMGLQGPFLSEDVGCAQWSWAAWVCPVWWVQVGPMCHATWPTSLCLPPQPPGPEELACSSEDGRENLLHQAMQNSGIVLERVSGEEGTLDPAPPATSSPQPLGDGAPELPLLEVEQVETVGVCVAGVPLSGC